LSKSHRQVLISTRETSPVSIAAITGYTLLKLVGGQVIHELSKYGLADIHPSLSAIRPDARRAGFSLTRAQKVEIEKSTLPPIALIQSRLSRTKKV
jgi:hypothetical protein